VGLGVGSGVGFGVGSGVGFGVGSGVGCGVGSGVAGGLATTSTSSSARSAFAASTTTISWVPTSNEAGSFTFTENRPRPFAVNAASSSLSSAASRRPCIRRSKFSPTIVTAAPGVGLSGRIRRVGVAANVMNIGKISAGTRRRMGIVARVSRTFVDRGGGGGQDARRPSPCDRRRRCSARRPPCMWTGRRAGAGGGRGDGTVSIPAAPYDVGNPATWCPRPVALRPRLTTGVPVRFFRSGRCEARPLLTGSVDAPVHRGV
jgi:hypothetical protein